MYILPLHPDSGKVNLDMTVVISSTPTVEICEKLQRSVCMVCDTLTSLCMYMKVYKRQLHEFFFCPMISNTPTSSVSFTMDMSNLLLDACRCKQ